MRSEYKKLITNTGLLAIGSFASSILGMLLIPFYTAVLSPADYGISDLITTTTALLYPFTTLAISEAIMRFALDREVDKKSVYSIGILFVVIGYILLLLFSPIIKRTAIGEYNIFFMLYYLLYCIHTITSYFVKGIEDVKTYSTAGVITSFTVILCNLVFLLGLKMGIKGYLLSFIIGHLVTTVFMYIKAKVYKFIIPIWKINRNLMKQMILYSIPIIPNSISWWISNSSDKYVLNHFADVSQVGIYAVSYKIPTIMMTVMGFFISAWQLSSVEDFGSEKSQQFFSDIYKKCFSINMLLASFLIALTKLIGFFLYSADFFVAWKYVPVLVFANVFNVMASFLGTIYTASKRTKMLSLSTMIAASVNLLMNFILIPSCGAMGAAIATAMSYFLMWTIRLVNTKNIMPITMNLKKDVIFILLLLLEIWLVNIDVLITQIMSFVIFGIIAICYRNTVIEIFKMMWGTITSKAKDKI